MDESLEEYENEKQPLRVEDLSEERGIVAGRVRRGRELSVENMVEVEEKEEFLLLLSSQSFESVGRICVFDRLGLKSMKRTITNGITKPKLIYHGC